MFEWYIFLNWTSCNVLPNNIYNRIHVWNAYTIVCIIPFLYYTLYVFTVKKIIFLTRVSSICLWHSFGRVIRLSIKFHTTRLQAIVVHMVSIGNIQLKQSPRNIFSISINMLRHIICISVHYHANQPYVIELQWEQF